MNYEFIKMNGLGNDFVIFDGRRSSFNFTPQALKRIADRHTGIGCDQVIVLEPPTDPRADVFMRIYNADGTEAQACGNAARCIAWLIAKDLDPAQIVIETAAGLRHARCTGDHEVAVDMGYAVVEEHLLSSELSVSPLKNFSAVNVGNSHIVFFVENLTAINLAELGPKLQDHPLFPAGVNVNIAQIISPAVIQLRVWERGAGLTQACGTGACATVAAAVSRHFTKRNCQVIQVGGSLRIAIIEKIASR